MSSAGQGNDDEDRAGDGSKDRLLRDVRHAAGNVLHRMYCWAALLERLTSDARANEALAGLKGSVHDLSRLISRTIDLVSAVPAAPVPLPAAEVVSSLAVRLSAKLEVDVPSVAALSESKIIVDPVVLERASALLRDLLLPRCDAAAKEPVLVASVDNDAGEGGATLVVRARASTVADREAFEPYAVVEANVCIALASKLLDTCGWQLAHREIDDGIELSILVPLIAGRALDVLQADVSENQESSLLH